jgi:putative cardiolipin synthase
MLDAGVSLFESPTMASAMADVFATHMPGRVYKVGLSDGGELQWVEQEEAGQRVYDQEPGTSVWLRLGVSVMSLLPIDWLL